MSMMERALQEIVGKTIKAVVFDAQTLYEQRKRFFLIFADGSYFEFFGDDVRCSSGINWGGDDAGWYRKRFGIDVKVIGGLPE